MATVSNVKPIKNGVVATVTMSNSYTTNGESVTKAQLGLTEINSVSIDGGNGYRPQYDYTNQKVKIYTSAGTETTATTDLSAVVLRLTVSGY